MGKQERESTGEKKREGRGRGRCGGWSETKNVSTSGRNSSLSEAVWLSQVCVTELPEHFTSRVLFPRKSKKTDYTCPASLTSDPIQYGSEEVTEVIVLCKVLCLREGLHREGILSKDIHKFQVAEKRVGRGFHVQHPGHIGWVARLIQKAGNLLTDVST